MSTLKKVLALTIVFAFAFAMMAGAVTTFTDNSNITNQDQVNLVNALGIMVGYPDGSFGPTKTITRAEAAKMMYVLKTGKDQGSGSYVNAANAFTDVPSSYWAAGYINYCYLNGIIAGIGNNKFDPEGSLTGVQLAKMLLTVIGYNATRANLVGSQWMISTMSLAFDNALFDNYTLDVSASATRQQAAVLFYNAIMAPTVIYNADQGEYSNLTTGLSVNGSTVSTGTTYNPTVGEKYFALEVETGVLYEAGGISLQGGKAAEVANGTFCLDISDPAPAHASGFGMGAAGTVKTFEDNDYSTAAAQAYLGQTVKMVYDTKNDKVYSIVPAKKDIVFSTTAGAISNNHSVNGNSSTDQFKINGKLYQKDSTCLVAFDTGNADGTIDTAYLDKLYTSGVNSMDNVKLVDFNGDGYIDVVYGTESSFGYVSSMDSKSIDFGNSAIDLLDNAGNQQVFATGVTEGSYVTWYKDAATDDYYVKPCTVVTGTVDGIRGTDIRVNGTYYSQGKFSSSQEDAIGGTTAPVSLPKINDNVTIYTDGKYWLGYTVGSSIASGDYAYVVAAQPKSADGFTSAKVQVRIPGEDKVQTYVLNENSTYGPSNATMTMTSISQFVGQYFGYSIKSDGSILLSQGFSNWQQTAQAVTFDSDSNIFTINGSSYLLASDAVIFYNNNGTMSVLGPSDFDTAITSGATITFNYTTSGSFKYINAGILTTTSAINQGGANSDIHYAYTTSTCTTSKDSDGNLIVEYSVWVNGAVTTLKQIDPDSPTTGVGSRQFISYKLGSDGNIKPSYKVQVSSGITGARYGAIAGYNSSTGMITVDINKAGDQAIYKITSDTVVTYVNNLNAAGATGSSFPRISATDLSKGFGNCFIVVNADHPTQLDFIAIDTSDYFPLS